MSCITFTRINTMRKSGSSIKSRNRFDYKNFRLTDDYQYKSEEEEQTSKKPDEKETPKKPDKKEPPKKQTIDDLREFNAWINREEIGINRKLFQNHFKMQRPSDMLKALYTTNNKKKNSDLANSVKSGLTDLKKEIEIMSEEEKEIGKPNETVDVVKKIHELMIEFKEEWV